MLAVRKSTENAGFFLIEHSRMKAGFHTENRSDSVANTPITRPVKNKMRAHLEEILKMQKSILEQIEHYAREIEAEEYAVFLRDLGKNHQDLNRKVYNFMVRKCNR